MNSFSLADPTKQGEVGERSLPQYFAIQNCALFQVHTRTYQRYWMAILAVSNLLFYYFFWTGKSDIQFLSQKLDYFGITTIFWAVNRPYLENLMFMYLFCALFSKILLPQENVVSWGLSTISIMQKIGKFQ